MANKWFLIKGSEEQGPFNGKDLKEFALNGKMGPSDKLRNSETGKIIKANAIQGLVWGESSLINIKPEINASESPRAANGLGKLETGNAQPQQPLGRANNQLSELPTTKQNTAPPQFSQPAPPFNPTASFPPQIAQSGAMPPPLTPPQIPAENWFIHQNGNQFGPILGQDLQKLVAAKQIGLDALAWKDGMANWLPISQVFQNQIGANPIMPISPGNFVNMGHPNQQIQPFGSSGEGFRIPSFLLDMHLQRKVLAVLALLGVISAFLPWFSFNPMAKVSNMIPGFDGLADLADTFAGGDERRGLSNKTQYSFGYSVASGLIALLLFFIGFLASILGKNSQPLEAGSYRTATYLPIIGGAICAWHLIRFLISGISLQLALQDAKVLRKMPDLPDFITNPLYAVGDAGIGLYLGFLVFLGVIFWRQIYWFAFSKSK